MHKQNGKLGNEKPDEVCAAVAQEYKTPWKVEHEKPDQCASNDQARPKNRFIANCTGDKSNTTYKYQSDNAGEPIKAVNNVHGIGKAADRKKREHKRNRSEV